MIKDWNFVSWPFVFIIQAPLPTKRFQASNLSMPPLPPLQNGNNNISWGYSTIKWNITRKALLKMTGTHSIFDKCQLFLLPSWIYKLLWVWWITRPKREREKKKNRPFINDCWWISNGSRALWRKASGRKLAANLRRLSRPSREESHWHAKVKHAWKAV